MDFTDRMVQDPEDYAYRWYYDMKYGQDRTVLKIIALVCGLVALMGFLLPLTVPDAKMSVWESGGIALAVSAFAMLLGWGINAMMYKMQGGKFRVRYILDRNELTVLSEIRAAKGIQAMGGAVVAAGLLAGSAGGILTGAGMAGLSQKAVVRLEKASRIVLHPDRDLIVLRCGLQFCQIFVPAEDFETLKEFLLTYTPRSVRVTER